MLITTILKEESLLAKIRFAAAAKEQFEVEVLNSGLHSPEVKKSLKVPSLSNPVVVFFRNAHSVYPERCHCTKKNVRARCHLVILVEFSAHILTSQDILRRTCLIQGDLVERV